MEMGEDTYIIVMMEGRECEEERMHLHVIFVMKEGRGRDDASIFVVKEVRG